MLKTTIHIPEGQIAGVHVGNEASITLPAYPGKKLIGKITRIAPVADLPAHTFAAEVSVDNSEVFWPASMPTLRLQLHLKLMC